MRDPYDTLGIKRDASPDDIKRAYRSMSKEWHPDKHKGDKAAEDKFKEVNEAYSILSDPKKKQQFDQFGSTGQQGGFGGGGFDFSNFNFGGQGGMPDLEDLFGSFFGGGRRTEQQRRGEDLETTVTIALQDVVGGVDRSLRIKRFVACSTCGGNGAAPGSETVTCSECGGTGTVTKRNSSFFGVIEQRMMCPRCGGSGRFPEKACADCSGEGRRQETSEFSVHIPAGVQDGQTLRVTGGGNAGKRGEKSGDLYVHIQVTPDERFVRDGNDIHTTLSIHVLQAILGDEVEVETLQGSVRLKIPEGTQPMQVLRIKGKGLPSLDSGRIGNHDVHIDIEIPKKLSRAERKVLEEWKTASGR